MKCKLCGYTTDNPQMMKVHLRDYHAQHVEDHFNESRENDDDTLLGALTLGTVLSAASHGSDAAVPEPTPFVGGGGESSGAGASVGFESPSIESNTSAIDP